MRVKRSRCVSPNNVHGSDMDKQAQSVTLTEEHRAALQTICQQRKVDALVWKRARAFLLLDEGEKAQIVCRILDIGPTVLTERKFAFAGAGLSFFGMKDYSQRQGHLFVAQETALKEHFTKNPAGRADEVCAYILAEYGQSYCASGAAKLMRRLGFVYKKPQTLPAQADEAKQEAFIAAYDALLAGLGNDEMVVHLRCSASDPSKPSRPRLVPKRSPSKPAQGVDGLTSKGRLILRPSTSPLWKLRRSMR